MSPFDSCGVSSSILGMSSGSPSISTFFRRGSITRSVKNQPMPMMRMLERLVNSQLHSGLTCTVGSMTLAAAWVMPWSRGSMPEGTKLALKPPETPAKAAAMPAMG